MEPKHIFKIEEDFENIRFDKWFKKKGRGSKSPVGGQPWPYGPL